MGSLAAMMTVQDNCSHEDKLQESEDYDACVALIAQDIVIGVCKKSSSRKKVKRKSRGTITYHPGKVSRIVNHNQFYVSYDDGEYYLEHTQKSTWRLI